MPSLTEPDGPPLAGIRVVELSHYIAGPAAGLRLADLGADVVKIESPTGDAARRNAGGPGGDAMFRTFNRNKRSVVLDLQVGADREKAADLCAAADVVIHNMSESAMARHGLDVTTLRPRCPSLVYAVVRGYPRHSEASGRKGFDSLAQCESGMLSVNGEPSGGPLRVPFSPVDVVAGDVLATAVVAELLRSWRLPGRPGGFIEVSLFEVAMHLQDHLWGEFLQTGEPPRRVGNLQPLVAPASEIYPTTDGFMMISAYAERHWESFCTVLGLEELLADERFLTNADRIVHRPELNEILARPFATLSMDEASELMERAGIAYAAVRDYPQVLDGPLLRDSGMLLDLAGPAGQRHVLGSPFVLDDRDRVPAVAPPALGEHTAEVVAEWLAEGTTHAG